MTITYKIITSDIGDIKTGTESRSYTPTLADAKEWGATTEKFVYVLDLLELSLVTEGDRYCTAKIEAVEDAYDALLSNAVIENMRSW